MNTRVRVPVNPNWSRPLIRNPDQLSNIILCNIFSHFYPMNMERVSNDQMLVTNVCYQKFIWLGLQWSSALANFGQTGEKVLQLSVYAAYIMNSDTTGATTIYGLAVRTSIPDQVCLDCKMPTFWTRGEESQISFNLSAQTKTNPGWSSWSTRIANQPIKLTSSCSIIELQFAEYMIINCHRTCCFKFLNFRKKSQAIQEVSTLAKRSSPL